VGKHEQWDMGSFLSPPQEEPEGKEVIEDELESLF
jgi:hypothetical protein